MESFGAILRKRREEKNIGLDTVSRDTIISKQYLEALENENIDIFPGDTYVTGFLRNYGEYLGLDSAYLVKLFHGKRMQESPVPENLIIKRHINKKVLAAAVSGGVCLLALCTFLFVYFLVIKPNNKKYTAVDLKKENGQSYTISAVPPQAFIDLSDKAGCPVLQTDLESTDFSSRLLRLFSDIFAPRKSIHGVLVEVYGIGIIILGDSGVGKSETALELVHRGHRLVADDIVNIRCVNGNVLLGQGANKMISHHMEVRGLGIINIQQLYGVGAIREQKEVQMVVKLEEWDANKLYDRLGTAQKTEELLGVKIPALEIPVRPGRNIPIILETAAMNERLKSMGYYSARDFNQNVLRWIESGEAQSAYYGNDDLY